MESTKSRIHNPHERWCTGFALQLCGEVKIHRVFRQYLIVDAVLFMKEQVDLWADLAPYLVGRETLIEHFSNSVSTANFGSCQEKIGHALKNYENIPRKNRGDQKAPCLVMLADRRPDRLLREFGAFEQLGTPGMWMRRPLELGAMFLVAA